MTSTLELKNVSDDALLRRLSELVQQSRRVESVLIAHIAEVDARRLYAREAGSMFSYCTQLLHLSEHEAYARITVARASRRYPVLLAMLGDGRLHLSGIGKLVPHLTDANHKAVLARATHKTKSKIEELVAEIAPKPDVPSSIRMLPERVEISSSGDPATAPVPAGPAQLGPERVPVVTSAELGLDRVGRYLSAPPVAGSPFGLGPARVAIPLTSFPARPAELPLPAPPPAAAVTPLSPARFKVQFTASAELRDKLERLQALTREDLPAVIEAAVTEKLQRLESKRFGITESPRKSMDQTDTIPSSRYLPAPVRRTVQQRDGNQCTFINRNGSRCTERRGLEFHHRKPFGRGGAHSPDNVCVMCRQHNAYLAELDYGKTEMAKYRRRDDRVSEGSAHYAVGLRLTTFPLREARVRDARGAGRMTTMGLLYVDARGELGIKEERVITLESLGLVLNPCERTLQRMRLRLGALAC